MTITLVQNLLLTSKHKFRFGLTCPALARPKRNFWTEVNRFWTSVIVTLWTWVRFVKVWWALARAFFWRTGLLMIYWCFWNHWQALPKKVLHCVWTCIYYFNLAVCRLSGVMWQHGRKHAGASRENQAVHGECLVLTNYGQVRNLSAIGPQSCHILSKTVDSNRSSIFWKLSSGQSIDLMLTLMKW